VAVIKVPLEDVVDWDAAHTALARALQFPDYYGRNGNAFIDCLTDITHGWDVPPLLAAGETLTIDLGNTSLHADSFREVTDAICGWVASVNWRDIQEGLPARVLIASFGA
jgi:hypothetical protein